MCTISGPSTCTFVDRVVVFYVGFDHGTYIFFKNFM